MLSVKMPKSSRALYQNGIYSITVNTFDVDHLLASVMYSISPPVLYAWMDNVVQPYFSDQIVDRFAYGGDAASGNWAPLSAATRRLRHALGFYDDFAINERTGEFLHWLAYSGRVTIDPGGAMLSLPGPPPDGILEKKLRTAQHGDVQGPGDMLPGAVTPPRPVLALDAQDLANIMAALQLHIINTVGRSLA